MTVWCVHYGLDGSGIVAAIYNNEAAARAHVAHYDRLILSGDLGPGSVLSVVAHCVLDDFGHVLRMLRSAVNGVDE